MSALSELFPEVARYSAGEARPGRLVAAALTTVVVGACFYLIDASGDGDGTKLYYLAFWSQAALLLVYGAVRTAGSVHAERVDKTWDLQRLTPCSAWEVAAGKLLGAPIFAYFVAGTLLPWALAGFAMSEKVPLRAFLWHQASLLCVAFLILSLGLLGSAHSEERNVGSSSPAAGGAVLGMLGLSVLGTLCAIAASGTLQEVSYFGVPVPALALAGGTFLLFGAWALAAATWRVGRDFLEPPRAWRIPAFLAFLTVFQLGFEKTDYFLCMILPAFMVFFISVLNPEDSGDWRRWVSGGCRDLDRMPTWVLSCASYAVIAVLLTAVGLFIQGTERGATWRYPLLQTFFLVRDMSFLQLCRFSRSRRPEVMALVFIGLSYVLCVPLFALLRLQHAAYIFLPAVDQGVSAVANFLPALVQAVGALCIVVRVTRDRIGPRA